MDLSPFALWRSLRGPSKLIVLAMVCCVFFFIFTMAPQRNDALWWRHVGLPETAAPHKVTDVVTQAQPTKLLQPPDLQLFHGGSRAEEYLRRRMARNHEGGHGVNVGNLRLMENSDFSADYDVKSIVMSPNAPVLPERLPLFEYIAPGSARHPFAWLSAEPRVAIVPNFIHAEEAQALIAIAEKEVRPGNSFVVVAADNEAVKVLVSRVVNFLSVGERVVKELTFERLLVSHQNKELEAARTVGMKIVATVFLGDVEAGGELHFPLASGKSLDTNTATCAVGLRIPPKQGTLAVVYGAKPNGETDAAALTRDCPVKYGSSWKAVVRVRLSERDVSP